MVASSSTIEGIIVPLVTPLAGPDVLDVAALESLIEHVIGGGVHGIFILGSCGEGPSLSYKLRKDLISRACQQVAGRVSVWVGMTDSSGSEADTIARYAADLGATGVVIAPPFYFPLSRDELVGFTRNRVCRAPLPVVIYNMPALTKVDYTAEAVRQLADEEKIIGIKDSSGNLDVFQSLLEAARVRADWKVLMGPENLLIPALRMGGHGGVAGGANIFPELFARIYQHSIRGEQAEVDKLAESLDQHSAIYTIAGGGPAGAVKALKAALTVIGIGQPTPVEPLLPVSPQTLASIREIVLRLAGI